MNGITWAGRARALVVPDEPLEQEPTTAVPLWKSIASCLPFTEGDLDEQSWYSN